MNLNQTWTPLRHGMVRGTFFRRLVTAGLALLAAVAWTGFAQTPVPPPGTGSAGDPYQISALGHLVWMGDTVSQSTNKYYQLLNDIDASTTTNWNDSGTSAEVKEGFKPIGWYVDEPNNVPFQGVFDGQGHVVRNLTINRTNETAVGFFGYVGASGRVMSLQVESVAIAGNNYVGGLVGANVGAVTNCAARGSVQALADGVGGLVGFNAATGIISGSQAGGNVTGGTDPTYGSRAGGLVGANLGTITNCSALGSVQGGDGQVGGLAGLNWITGSISGSQAGGNVTAGGYTPGPGSQAGGLVGANQGVITNCSALGSVQGASVGVGGLVGINWGTGSISGSQAGGHVTGNGRDPVYASRAGGLVGQNVGTITNCFALGSVQALEAASGGLVGMCDGLVSRCYSAGSVGGTTYVGGLVGWQRSGSIDSSYWDIQTSGRSTSAGSAASFGKTTAQMKQQATFVGWDFVTTWRIAETLTYPELRNVPFSPPWIVLQPGNQVAAVGATVNFLVRATGGGAPLSYQWYFGATPLVNSGRWSGVNSANLTLTAVQLSDGGNYRVVITNVAGSVASSWAALHFSPTVTTPPQNQTNVAGTTARFSVIATSSTLPAYQWRFQGTNIPNGGNVSGAATTTLTLANVQLRDAGNYSVVVSNTYGRTTSTVAALTVWLPPALQITRSGPQVRLSWVTNVPGFVVETSPSLSVGAVWQVVTYGVTLSGNRFWVTNQPFSNPAFYRLRQVTSTAIPTDMVVVPAGPFVMGATLDGDTSALPLHTNQISEFYMDKYAVTKALWDEVFNWATIHGYSFDSGIIGQGKAANHPVQTVNWYDCVKWCNARSEKEARVPAYYTDYSQTVVYRGGQPTYTWDYFVKWSSGYRLPTEAEWEKAARGGLSGQRFPWGNTISWSQANYSSGWSGGVPYYPYDVNPTPGYPPTFNDGVSPYTSPVGSFAANGYGLYDMAGNVLQWCWDVHVWPYSGSAQTDPRGPAYDGYVSSRVLRGGCWNYSAYTCRAAYRYSNDPMYRYYNIGFRCVLPPGQ